MLTSLWPLDYMGFHPSGYKGERSKIYRGYKNEYWINNAKILNIL